MVETALGVGFVALLAAIAVADARRRVVPDPLSLGGLAAALAASAICPGLHHAEGPLAGLAASGVGAAAGVAAGLLMRWLGSVLFRRRIGAARQDDPAVDAALGMGDVKLLGFMGAFLGWGAIPPVLLVACVAGAGYGAVHKLVTGEAVIPFAPFLCLGGAVYFFRLFPATVFGALTG